MYFGEAQVVHCRKAIQVDQSGMPSAPSHNAKVFPLPGVAASFKLIEQELACCFREDNSQTTNSCQAWHDKAHSFNCRTDNGGYRLLKA